MRICALIPLFREPADWIKDTIINTSLYADDTVICVNDTFNANLKEFLYSFDIVKKVAFINKDFCQDSIYNSSLLTLVQSLSTPPDWIIKQDIDEEFEARATVLKEALEHTEFDMLDVLWPSYVSNKQHLCYYTHAQGVLKTCIFRFDLNKLYIPGGLHKNISMLNAKKGLITLNLYHKNLIRTDQENYIKFVTSGREIAKDGCVTELRKQLPDVLEQGKYLDRVTHIKREKDAERLLPHSIRKKIINYSIPLKIMPLNQLNRSEYLKILREMYE